MLFEVDWYPIMKSKIAVFRKWPELRVHSRSNPAGTIKFDTRGVPASQILLFVLAGPMDQANSLFFMEKFKNWAHYELTLAIWGAIKRYLKATSANVVYRWYCSQY